MAYTALTIITDALLDLGVIAGEETPAASDASGGLRKLNNLLDAWNIDPTLAYGAYENVFNLTPNQGVYTLGAGGDFNIPRPNRFLSAYIRDTSLPVEQRYDQPIEIFNDQEYADLPYKAWTSTYPFLGIFIDSTFPLQNVYLNPVPNSSQYQLVLWTEGVLSNLTLDQVISLPPGYKRALTANLTIELAAQYGQPVAQTTAMIASSSKADIRALNQQFNTLSLPRQLTGGGWYMIESNRYN